MQPCVRYMMKGRCHKYAAHRWKVFCNSARARDSIPRFRSKVVTTGDNIVRARQEPSYRAVFFNALWFRRRWYVAHNAGVGRWYEACIVYRKRCCHARHRADNFLKIRGISWMLLKNVWSGERESRPLYSSVVKSSWPGAHCHAIPIKKITINFSILPLQMQSVLDSILMQFTAKRKKGY